jgi:hypothetical protein
VPFATGGGAVIRASRATNQAIDAARAAERAAEATRNIDRAADASKGLDRAGDAAKSSNVADTQKALNPTNCFIAGTEIITRDGTKNIEDIQVGDWVLADDPNTVGEIEYKQVLQTFARSATAMIDIYIDGEKITTTEEHPFWVPGVGWVLAKDLNVGNYLQTKTESLLDIDKIESYTSPIDVYNFEVEGFHTYFVSDLGLLVHNSSCGKNAAELRKNMENAGETFNQGDAAHHIVPSTDGRTQAAIDARNTLNGHGIGINDAPNGVPLPKSQHDGQGLHRGTTYQAVNDRLSQATNKAEAESILRDIAAEIKAGTFP